MYIVLISHGANGLDWIGTHNKQEDAITHATEIEKTLEPEEIVCVIPFVYFKQK